VVAKAEAKQAAKLIAEAIKATWEIAVVSLDKAVARKIKATVVEAREAATVNQVQFFIYMKIKIDNSQWVVYFLLFAYLFPFGNASGND
jgi:hypothetical protein